MLPLLALTWMSAVLAVTDRRSALFQILFAVFDSLEGFVIVMVHCILRREVRRPAPSQLLSPTCTPWSWDGLGTCWHWLTAMGGAWGCCASQSCSGDVGRLQHHTHCCRKPHVGASQSHRHRWAGGPQGSAERAPGQTRGMGQGMQATSVPTLVQVREPGCPPTL